MSREMKHTVNYMLMNTSLTENNLHKLNDITSSTYMNAKEQKEHNKKCNDISGEILTI